MSLFTKLFKGVAGKADDVIESKSTRKAAAEASKKVASGVKDFASGELKTTSAVLGQGVSKATSGGVKAATREVASNFAKGTGGLARVGGKVVAGSAIASVPIVGGIGLVNYYKNSMALTDEDRRLAFLVDQQKELEEGTNNSANSSGNLDVDSDPTALGNTGVGGSSYGGGLSPLYDLAYGKNGDDSEDNSSGSGLGLLGFAGIAAAAAGGYYLYKKNKKSANKSTA
ncbi:MAG: hypothetical protein KC589_07920 [Nanoarchaeota archaeon]|nr:hypothetical protein [Nanoarchaeota archaeon]